MNLKLAAIRVRGGVLALVLAVSLLIAMLISSLIVVTNYQRILVNHYDRAEKLTLNARSGTSYLLASEGNTDSLCIDLFGKGSDSVLLKTRSWGLYTLQIATAFSGKNSKSEISLVGFQPSGMGKSCLYLSDATKPINISGNTSLKGDCYIPLAGIRSSQFEGINFRASKVVDGNIYEDNRTFPPVNIEPSTYRDVPMKYPGVTIIDIPKSIKRSFLNPTLIIKTEADLALTQEISGNIIISSAGMVTLTSSALLTDALVFASRIVVEQSFQGNVQLFATEEIVIEEDVQLSYPSALVINSEGATASIVLHEGSTIEGAVIIARKNTSTQSLIHIKSNSTIRGEVYCDGAIELKGRVEGHVTCRKFFLATPSAIYENYIVDGNIDYNARPVEYLTTGCWWDFKQKGIVKWLD